MRMRWKTIWENPKYEISKEGNVRVKEDHPNAGYVLKRYTAMTHQKPGSLCVDIYGRNSKKPRRIWKLMARYWPDVECPEGWRSTRNIGRTARNPKTDRRIKLNMKQYREVIASTKTSGQLAEIYPVSARYIRKIKNGEY